MYPRCWNKPHALCTQKISRRTCALRDGLKERSAHEERRANRKQHWQPHSCLMIAFYGLMKHDCGKS
ncbi:hypothetical protein ALC56_09002 [Trachymyrmex septentrionalis]|uniref:Uncharacterized protein n=1 Tax=Trachymyrmex septentrionalis TaxID=34720 RepID=A0A195FA08_9HYME|nr:hypothetical protein ALC56_09002 [Trachymyrmex septentrionalis]